MTSRSGVFNTMCHNGSYLVLFRKEDFKILKLHVNNYFYFEISVSFFQASSSKKRSILTPLWIMLQNDQTYFENLAVFTPQNF